MFVLVLLLSESKLAVLWLEYECGKCCAGCCCCCCDWLYNVELKPFEDNWFKCFDDGTTDCNGSTKLK